MQQLYGKLNTTVIKKNYRGLNSQTAKVKVDDEINAIQVDVKKVPGDLKINLPDDSQVVFNGNEDIELNLIDNETFNSLSESVAQLQLSDKAKQPLNLKYLNIVIPSEDWSADNTYPGYGYKCRIELENFTEDIIPQVTFSAEEALSGNYLPIAQSFDGGIYIWSKVNNFIIIPTIIGIK